MNSQFANIATPSEIVVSTSFSLEFGGSQAEMHVCFPYSMVEPIRDLLYSTMQSDHLTQDNRWIKLLTRQLQTAELELVCNLGTAGATLRDIVNMRVGDVIPLDVPELLQGEVDGAPVLELRYGTLSGHYAVKVERFVALQDADPPPFGGQHG
jgi:flagellar motor switch protein FliM